MPPNLYDPSNKFERICILLDRLELTFSKAVAAKLVGGEYRLEKLIRNGEIRADKPTAKQNGKWFCNGGDVLRHVKL